MGADGTSSLSLSPTTGDLVQGGRRFTRVDSEVYRLDEMTLGTAYDLCARGQAQRALLGLMERIELAASEGRLEDISALLTRTIVDRLDPSVLIGMLSIAKHARDRLTSWQTFLARVEAHLVRTLGQPRTEALLRHRRG